MRKRGGTMLEMYKQQHTISGLRTPVRNRYFYGKLLDAYHFELETDYFNQKRWLINRMVLGYGVVCGLDVEAGPERDTVVVKPGLALDKWGREIVVPEETGPISLLRCGRRRERRRPTTQTSDAEHKPEANPEQKQEGDPKRQQPPCEETDPKRQMPPRYEEFDVRVVICYHECESDPVPVRAGDCETVDPCAPGAVRERYRLCIRDGFWEPEDLDECSIPDLIFGGGIDYDALAKWVTGGCPGLDEDPCIPLANIRVIVEEEGDHCHPDEIDITARPIVYSNDVLWNIIQSYLIEPRRSRRGR
jgi:hypothetical protein